MTMFNDIFNRHLPHSPAHATLEVTDRLKTPHVLGILLALGTLSLQAHVGQAGIGDPFGQLAERHFPLGGTFALGVQPRTEGVTPQ